MRLSHILAACDESDAGRDAMRTALDLAARSGAQVSAVRVETRAPAFAGFGHAGVGLHTGENHSEIARFRRWLEADSLYREASQVQVYVTCGIPGIEICRAAELLQADLIVLGRKRHSQQSRLLLGDTADAVARRSRFPCLLVPRHFGAPRSLLVALDGSDRGMTVLHGACGFARELKASIQVVTVERGPADEPRHLAAALPITRSSSLESRVMAVFRRESIPELAVAIRRGDISQEILAEVLVSEADVLVIGYHRGGPPGVLEAGSVARKLAHAAPCAVLTIPL